MWGKEGQPRPEQELAKDKEGGLRLSISTLLRLRDRTRTFSRVLGIAFQEAQIQFASDE